MVKLYARPKSSVTDAGPGDLSIAIVNLIPFLGDAIIYLPLVDHIRKAHRDATITVFCDSSVSELYRSYPGIDEVFAVPNSFKWATGLPLARLYARFFAIWKVSKATRKTRQFDIALIPRGGPDPYFSAHMARIVGIPRIYGYSSELEPERRFMTQHAEPLMSAAVESKRGLHESIRALEVAELAGLLTANSVSEDEVVEGLKQLANAQDQAEIYALAGIKAERGYAVIAPGAGIRRREWLPERFREIVLRVNREFGLQVLVTGTSKEEGLVDSICSTGTPEIKNMSGKLSILQLIALLDKAALFVGNDSGVGHIAGALGVPTVSLNAYALSGQLDHHQSPARNRPMGPRVRVLQPERFLPPCREECLAEELHCLGQIGTEEVWNAIMKMLRGPELK